MKAVPAGPADRPLCNQKSGPSLRPRQWAKRAFAVGLPLRSSPRSGPSDGEGIVEDVPIAKQATGEMKVHSVELVDFGSARTILFSH